MKRARTVCAPVLYDLGGTLDGKRAFWKQVLPVGTINYKTKTGKDSTLTFDEKYLTDLTNAFAEKALDQTPFMLAGKDNEHTMDPERQRGEVTDMRLALPGEKPGLYARIEFPTEAAAMAVMTNPKLGVSARIREDATGKRAMLHVLGTLDPQVTGMAPWVPAVDLSFDPTDKILDLSGATVADNKTEPVVPAIDDEDIMSKIDKMTEAELDAFLSENGVVFSEGDLESVDAPVEPVKELEPALSTTQHKDIELANAAASQARARADEALRRMAAAEWSAYRATEASAGVPPHVLDLAAPILNRPEPMLIDLSHENKPALDASDIVRKLVEGYRGMIDLSAESGHLGSYSAGSEADPDAGALAAWEAQFPRH